MKKSASATLSIAGREMSHIPKRAAGHSVHLSNDEIQPITLKQGVQKLERQMYTQEAKINAETYIDTDNEKGSEYNRSLARFVVPNDYKNPRRPIRQSEPTVGVGHQGTAHWTTENRSKLSDDAVAGAVKFRQHGPPYRPMNPPTCVGNGDQMSSYQQDYGKPGHDPVSLIRDTDRNPVIKSALTYGTCKGTKHIPGYQGFLSQVPPFQGTPEPGGVERTTFDKTNLHETYHVNLLGYSGHVPQNPRNQNGGRKMDMRCTFNRDFPPHDLKAFA